MGPVLPGSARTTAAVWAALQRRQQSRQPVVARYGIHPQTGATWRKRTNLVEPTPASTVLPVAQETLLGAVRRHMWRPCDKGLYAL
jgi:hypothetical protein